MHRPTVALIISTYNSPRQLELTLESVCRQSVMPEEVIIADDGSTQYTRAIVKRFKEQLSSRVVHCWQPDRGFQLSAIRNKAIREASSEYIVSIDGDLILHPHFIRDHLQVCQPGMFIQGSRVLVSEQLTMDILNGKEPVGLNWLSGGIKNRLNAICSAFLSRLIAGRRDSKLGFLDGIRGCNMAFWRRDCLAVNGFNEDIHGWGREDSEFVIRLENHHVHRRNLKFGGVVYHLHHEKYSRESLRQNDAILKRTYLQKLERCENGINKYIYAPSA